MLGRVLVLIQMYCWVLWEAVKRCTVTSTAAPLSAVRSCPVVLCCSTLLSCVSYLGCSSEMVTSRYGAKALVLRDIHHLLLWLYPLKRPVQMAASRCESLFY